MNKIITHSFKVIFTVVFSLIGVYIFNLFGLPMPNLLGPIVIIALFAKIDYLPLKKPIYLVYMSRIILGLTIGSVFTPKILEQLNIYAFSLMLMPLFILITVGFGMYYYIALGYDKKTAYFCSMPGGLMEMVILCEQAKANVSKVALVHATRVLFVVIFIPFIIQYGFGIDTSKLTNLVNVGCTIWNPITLFLLAIVGFIGVVVGLKLKLPAAYLMGPIIASIFAYSFGFIEGKMPLELINFSQIIFGIAVGFTFKNENIKNIFKTIIQTFGQFLIIMIICFVFMEIINRFFGFSEIAVLLAFSPGGQAEMNIMALIVGIAVPYVTLHHILRLLIVVNSAKFLKKFLK